MANPTVRIIALIIVLTSSGCSSGALSLLTGGGPNVAANTQIGKENNQGVNTTINTTSRPELRPEGPVDTIVQDNSSTNISPFVLLLLVLGWLAPSPAEIGRGLLNMLLAIRGRK